MPNSEPYNFGREAMFSKSVPNLQRAWDATSLDAFTRCPRYYQLAILEGWRNHKDAIFFGLILHACLEEYDKVQLNGGTKDEAVFAAITAAFGMDEFQNWKSEDNRRTPYTVLRALVWYAEEFFDSDAIMPYKFADGTPAVELSFTLPLDLLDPDGNNFLVCGHLDGLAIVLRERIYVRERKSTAATLSSYYFKRYSPNTQISTYSAVSDMAFPDLGIAGVFVEACQTGVGFCRFERQPVGRSQPRRDEFMKSLGSWLATAERYARDDFWPMAESSCTLYGKCDFLDVCNQSPSHRKRYLKSHFHVEKWNPLKIR